MRRLEGMTERPSLPGGFAANVPDRKGGRANGRRAAAVRAGDGAEESREVGCTTVVAWASTGAAHNPRVSRFTGKETSPLKMLGGEGRLGDRTDVNPTLRESAALKAGERMTPSKKPAAGLVLVRA